MAAGYVLSHTPSALALPWDPPFPDVGGALEYLGLGCAEIIRAPAWESSDVWLQSYGKEPGLCRV